jgi:hypothetical protein
MTLWGTKRTYKVSRVRLDLNPKKTTFLVDGKNVSISSYFKQKYQIDLNPEQPLLEIGSHRDSILLPS